MKYLTKEATAEELYTCVIDSGLLCIHQITPATTLEFIQWLKVAFEKETGRLLGAHAIGIASVDKRIDVLATAMQAGMTIFDLEHLELAYAPPYGSAKYPVNMAGFVGSNLIRGDVGIVHAKDLELGHDNSQKVDVRSTGEFLRGHIPTTMNSNLNTLRDTDKTLDKTTPVVVYCQVGYRGYLGYRILKQMGFDVVNLDGRYKSILGGFKALQTSQEQLWCSVGLFYHNFYKQNLNLATSGVSATLCSMCWNLNRLPSYKSSEHFKSSSLPSDRSFTKSPIYFHYCH